MQAVSPVRLRVPLVALALVAVCVGACGDRGTPSVAGPPPSPAASPVASPAPSGSAASPSAASVGPSRSPGAGGDRPDLAAATVALDVVTEGLDSPLWVDRIPDGSGRLAVGEQGGTIRVIEDGSLLPDPYLDITDRVLSGGERGLLGVAFPPGFGEDHETLFVHYSDRNGDTTIAAYDAPAGSTTIDPASERILLSVEQPYANHNGGFIGFDSTGMLLIALGDGGAGGDPENRASNLDELLGKLLRIDVLNAGDEPYAIPADNPFVDQADARPEVLHYGLRNPFRDSVDQETGAIWIGDVGQNEWEEIDMAPADARGLDFGWRRWEGSHCYDPNPGCDSAGVTMPVTEYPHSLGCSVIGGVVYHGEAIPALQGAYLFSDNCSGTLWAIDAGLEAPQAPITLMETGRSISGFGVDDAGEVYLADLGGSLVKLVPAAS
jgi:glucose/arabinose dehydrogenase